MYYHHVQSAQTAHTILWRLENESAVFERISLQKLPAGKLGGYKNKTHPDLERLERGLINGFNKRDRKWALARCDFSGCSTWQQQIWSYLALEVAPGQVISYGKLAESLGRPGAARSVGSTMAKNRFPMLIPCHRVVASGGKLGGFMNGEKEGLRIKRAILESERVYYVGASLRNDEALIG